MMKRKIYVASSWRNAAYPLVVETLRELGHEVYDFRNPPNKSGFGWQQVNPLWDPCDPDSRIVHADIYKDMLAHPIADAGYTSDVEALRGCDVVVYVLPCGRSASWEFGYAMGMGKPGVVLWLGKHEPELMFRDAVVLGSFVELSEAFAITE